MNTAIIATSSPIDIQSYSAQVADCIKTTSGFNGNTIHNICTGAVSYVPNGFWDYTGNIVLFLVGLVIAGLFGAMMLKIITD